MAGNRGVKILMLGGLPIDYLREWNITSDLNTVSRRLGIEFESVAPDRIRWMYDNLSGDKLEQSDSYADELIKGSAPGAPAEPPQAETVRNAVRLYHAIKELLRERQADAVTVDCAGLKRSEIPPLPCVTLTLLQEDGNIAVCQGDIDAVITAELMRRAGAGPTFVGGGFMLDGLLEVCHCVLPRRMAGPDTPLLNYHLADYHGSGKGCTIFSDVPVGAPATVARLAPNLSGLSLGVGITEGNEKHPQRGCRNSLRIKMNGAERLLERVKGHQQHLVVACGDHASSLSALADEYEIPVWRLLAARSGD